jgi:hypothetical protein
LEQNEQVHRVTVAGRFATVNWVTPQWQLPFTAIVSSPIKEIGFHKPAALAYSSPHYRSAEFRRFVIGSYECEGRLPSRKS